MNLLKCTFLAEYFR